MRTGRPNKGIEHAKKADASPETQRRLQVILATITGELSVKEACKQLHLSEKRFQQLREDAMQGAAQGLAPKAPGRPRKVDIEERAELDALREENERLKRELELERTARDLFRSLQELPPQAQKNAPPRKRRKR